jgi:hypothetical protein
MGSFKPHALSKWTGNKYTVVSENYIQGYYKRNRHFHILRSSVEERRKFVSMHSSVTSAPRQRPWHHSSKTFYLRYYANCVSITLKVLILHNVESVYFFYSNPVIIRNINSEVSLDCIHRHETNEVRCLDFTKTSDRFILLVFDDKLTL